jgi:hypothetical protein
MKNFDRLHQAGLFPSDVKNEGDLAPDARQVINRLTSEEVEALISSFNKVDQGRQSEVQNLMRVASF